MGPGERGKRGDTFEGVWNALNCGHETPKVIIKKLPNCMYQRPDKVPDLPPQIINTKSPTCMYRAVLRAHF